MKNLANNSNFFLRVYAVVKRIPEGKVATYGQIAQIVNSLSLSNRITPRLVGTALHKNPDPKNIPCHRVVDRNGRLAESYAFAWSADNRPVRRVRIEPKSRKERFGGGGWREQKRKLLEEDVRFRDEMHVDLDKFLWPGK
jgi:methylated-DNA-protein-cysteine methyltransferase-like protein